MQVRAEDFAAARVRVRPSAMREMNVEVPKVAWADVGGLEDVKQRLKEAVEWAHTHQVRSVCVRAKLWWKHQRNGTTQVLPAHDLQ
jgi:ATP-dependent 26S proteasome regulatory subunit